MRLPTPISMTVAVSAFFRPSRSATMPPSRPPRGRMKKPTAKIAMALSSGTTGSPVLGKNWLEKYSASME